AGRGASDGHGTPRPAAATGGHGPLCPPPTKGHARIDPNRPRTTHHPPPVAIEEITIDKRGYEAAKVTVVPPGRGEIEVHYAGLSLLEPEKVRFRYRLENFDAGWVDAATRRVAYYTNIPPGRYRFRVAAAHNRRVWNETGAGFDFELRPHVYQATWFFGLCGFGVALMAGGAYRVRIERLATRERRLQALVSERTRALEQANEMLSRFSYLDAVTGI